MTDATTTFAGLTWAPLLPWEILAAIAAIGLALIGLGLWRRARGVAWRLIPLAALLTTLAGPQLVRETRTPLDDVAVVVVDESASQDLGDRRTRTEDAVATLRERLKAEKGLEVRIVGSGRGAGGGDGTRLFDALDKATADVPRERLAGAVLITDGQVHDVPDRPARTFPAPVHALLTGEKGETDRRVVVQDAPSYGLVDKSVTLRVMVEDPAVGPGETVPLTVTLADGRPLVRRAVPGRPLDVEVPIQHGGANVVEVSVPPRAGEPTEANNRTAVTINGVRDRLRVLLVSGQPHVGERAWRRLLKSDPNVDLVHFTILRPPTKDDGTPLSELALIAFPVRELFEERLTDFDLVIFDRYSRQALVPYGFLRQLTDYVRGGGALLMAVGPEFAGPDSLFESPLSEIIPATPTGSVVSRRFVPELTDVGRRHPVTAALDGAGGPGQPPTWGPWLRHVEALTTDGDVVMRGADSLPLLLLSRIGDGRAAVLLSDTIWLWARGWEGGGPQPELVRRLAHWLMKEPELEEEALTARADGDRLVIERRTLANVETGPPTRVIVTRPDGETRSVMLATADPGRQRATLETATPGVYRVDDGSRSAVAAVGAADPLEMREVVATADRLSPVTEATGGGVFWLSDGGVPTLRRTAPTASRHAGSTWAGLVANGDYTVNGIRQADLMPPLAGLALVLGGLLLCWWREGR